jgi:hypothetical protein
MNEVFCCSGLENHVACAGERGLAILVRKTSQGPVFVLQSRGIAFEDLGKIKPTDVNIKINVSSESGLQYCPYCGQQLPQLVELRRSFFERLAEKHKKFLATWPSANQR